MLTHVLSLVTVLTVVGGPAGREAIGHQKRVFAAAAAAAAASLPACLPELQRRDLAAKFSPVAAPQVAFRVCQSQQSVTGRAGEGGQRRYSGRKRSSSCQQSTRGAPGQSERRGEGRGGWDRYGSPNTPTPTAALTSTVNRLIQP